MRTLAVLGTISLFALSACVPAALEGPGSVVDAPPSEPIAERPPPEVPPPVEMPVEDPKDPPVEDPMPDPDPTGISYARDVLPILEQHCTECHDEGRALNLAVRPTGPNGSAGALELILAAAAGPMPPAPRDRLPEAGFEMLRAWGDDGFLP